MSVLGSCSGIGACTSDRPKVVSGLTLYCLEVTNNTTKRGLPAESGEQLTWNVLTASGAKLGTVEPGAKFCNGNAAVGQWYALVDPTTSVPVTPTRQFTASDANHNIGVASVISLVSPTPLVPATGILAAKGKCGHIPRGLCKGYPATGGTAKSPVTYYCVEVTNNTKESGVAAVSGDQSTWVPFTTDGTTQLPSIDAGGTFCAANITVGLWFALVDSTGAPVTPLRQFTSKDAESTVGVPSVISLKEESKMWLLLIVLAVLVVAGLGLALLARRSK